MLHGSGHFPVRQSVAQGTEGVPSSPTIHDPDDAWQHAAATRYQIHFGPVVHFVCVEWRVHIPSCRSFITSLLLVALLVYCRSVLW